MNERIAQLRTVGNRLVWSLAPALVALGIPGALLANWSGQSLPTPVAVLFVGFVVVSSGSSASQDPARRGSDPARQFVGLDRALSRRGRHRLAELVYLLFISGLLAGNMFPKFVADNPGAAVPGLRSIFEVHCPSAADYAKVPVLELRRRILRKIRHQHHRPALPEKISPNMPPSRTLIALLGSSSRFCPERSSAPWRITAQASVSLPPAPHRRIRN